MHLPGRLIFLSIVFWMPMCSPDTKVENVLTPDQMVSVLVRLHLADSKASRSYMPPDSALMFYACMEDSILQAMYTDKTKFLNSYKHYIKEIKTMEEIYTRVIDSLAFREAIRNINY